MPAESTLHELLPWYVAGTLEPEWTDRFRAHLDACQACRAELVFLQQVQAEVERHGAAFLEDHPTSESLVAAVRGTLGEEQAAIVRRHLAYCVTCAQEAAWVGGEAVFHGAAAPGVTARPLGLGFWAAGVAAVLFLAALALFLVRDRAGEKSGIVRVHLVPSTEMGDEPRVVVPLEPGQRFVRLLLPVDLPDEAFPLSVRIMDAGGRSVVEAKGVGASALLDGYLLIDCVRTDCPGGAYTVHVTPSGAARPDLTFDFEVRDYPPAATSAPPAGSPTSTNGAQR